MVSRAADYDWFVQNSDRQIAENYCLTLIKNVPIDEVVVQLNGNLLGEYASLQEVWEKESEVATTPVAAMTRFGAWTFMAESGSNYGGFEPSARKLSRGTVLVSHTCSVDGDTEFIQAEDGQILLFFSPRYPAVREGSEPNRFVSRMEEAGFELGDNANGSQSTDSRAAAFALAELITGVQITADMLDFSNYKYVALPPL